MFSGTPVLNIIPIARTIMPPAAPIRFIMALALLLRGFIVTSGISATAGDRNVAIDTSVIRRTAMNKISGTLDTLTAALA